MKTTNIFSYFVILLLISSKIFSQELSSGPWDCYKTSQFKQQTIGENPPTYYSAAPNDYGKYISGTTTVKTRSIWYFEIPASLPQEAYITNIQFTYLNDLNITDGFKLFNIPEDNIDPTQSYESIWSISNNQDCQQLGAFPRAYGSPVTVNLYTLAGIVRDRRAQGKNMVYIGIRYRYEGSTGFTCLSTKFNQMEVTIKYEMRAKYTIANNFGSGLIKVNNDNVQSGYSDWFSPNQSINLEAIEPQFTTNPSNTYIWNDNEGITNKSEWNLLKEGNPPLVKSQNYQYAHPVTLGEHNSEIRTYMRKYYSISRDDDFREFDNLVNQGTVVQIVEQNSGTLSAPSSQTVNGRAYSFAGWSDGVKQSSRTISPTGNVGYTALYKLPKHSNNSEAYSKNSQRKFIRDGSGKLLSVYESMGKVWVEQSTNNGQSWTIENGGKAIGEDTKYPAIDYITTITQGTEAYSNLPIITYEKWPNSSSLQMMVGWLSTGNVYTETVITDNYSDEIASSPVIATMKNNKFVVVWWGMNDVNQQGLYYRYGSINSSLQCVWLSNVEFLDGSSELSQNPTIGIKKETATSVTVHIAWQEGDINSNPAIYYNTLSIDANDDITQGTAVNISSGSGYTQNYNPSIVAFGEGARVCWLGTRMYIGEKEEESPTEGGTSILEHRVIFKDPSYYRYWNFIKTNGNTARSPSINKTDGNTAYIFGWSEDDGSERVFANNSLNSIYTMVSTTGKDLQLSNGASTSSMYVNTFNSSSLPYSFASTIDINSFYGIQKSSGISISSGREGIVYKDSVQFYFCMGDISVDGEPVEFVELPDTLNVNNQIVINQSVVSKPFDLTNNSNFLYGVQYGIANPSTVTGILNNGKSVGFKVELIDAESNAVIGVFDDVTYNENSLNNYDNLFYQVNTSGIGSRTVKLRLQINENLNADYSISDKYSKTTMFNKQSLKEVSYQGSLAVNDYALNQNYPNPFNPGTVISYQLVAGGQVSLKVYDILGNEIVTLVDKEQESGRYQVTFDASKLASGVYICRIIAGDFVKTIKMSLVK